MLKLIIILIFVVIVAILILAMLKPNTFRVERTAIIPVSPDKVFPHINNFRAWKAWSAWDKKDLSMQTTYCGSPSGTGAIYEWSGNKTVGSGRLEIIESVAPSLVVVKLDFITPFEGHNKATFTLQEIAEGTKVIWVMEGPMAFVPKIFSIFVSMDKMIGKDFEDSLENLKAISQ
jgi:uncharacterized protein YndB with AHSA1/START domain